MKLIPHSKFTDALNKIYANRDIHCIKKTIIFIEPYGSTLSLLKHGLEKGYQIIILTANTDLRIVPKTYIESAFLSLQIDTSNDDEILNVIVNIQQILPIHCIIPGFEYFVPLAIKLNNYFNLPSIDENKIDNFRRKDIMRLTLQQAGILVPKFKRINNLEDLEKAVTDIGFPAICKPVDAAGSVHVKKVMNISEAILAANKILKGNDVLWGHSLEKSLLYEEYIDGKEYSLEGVVQKDTITHFSVTEKFVADQSEFIEIGHIVNAPIEQDFKIMLQNYVDRILKVLGAQYCPFHAEVRINSSGHPVLMEVACRLAGDKIGDLINLTHNTNYFDAIYSTYFGESVSNTKLHSSHAGIRFFYRPDVDQYNNVSGLEYAKHYPIEDICIYYEPNTFIPAFPKPLRRLGHVIIKSDHHLSLINMLDDIDKHIVFEA